MKPIRVLVTGAGSGVGQGIVKSLRVADLPVTVVAADISPLNSGMFAADEAVLIPKVESAAAREEIPRLIKRHGIDAVMIGSEFDLGFFASHRAALESETGALIIASPPETVAIADDKWLTTEFLKQHGLAHAPACLPGNAAEAAEAAAAYGYPVVLKSRTGTSSRNVHILDDEAALRRVFDQVPAPMLQAFAGAHGDGLAHEYTCSVFRCADGALLGPFTARRTLRGGSSWAIEVGHFQWLYPLLVQIGEALPSMGSLNVQLRDGPHGPIPFELNSRFSGTTAVRTHFGFNEPEFALRSYLLGQTIEAPVIGTGLALRYLEEIFVDGATASGLDTAIPRGTVTPWFQP